MPYKDKELGRQKARERYWDKREEILKKVKSYYDLHKEEISQKRRSYENKRYREDKEFLKRKKAVDIARYLPLKETCELCGSKKKLMHHHPDYNKPKVFLTVCEKCHYRKIHGVERG